MVMNVFNNWGLIIKHLGTSHGRTHPQDHRPPSWPMAARQSCPLAELDDIIHRPGWAGLKNTEGVQDTAAVSARQYRRRKISNRRPEIQSDGGTARRSKATIRRWSRASSPSPCRPGHKVRPESFREAATDVHCRDGSNEDRGGLRYGDIGGDLVVPASFE